MLRVFRQPSLFDSHAFDTIRDLLRIMGLIRAHRDRRAAIIAAIAVVAHGARLYHLDRRGISHPELFAPGIPLPAYTVEPQARHTFQDVIRDTLTGDIHPPAYYLAERVWTRLAGISLVALRLPSAPGNRSGRSPLRLCTP